MSIPPRSTRSSSEDVYKRQDVCARKADYARSVKTQYDEQDHVRGKALLQRHGKRVLIQNPPAKPLTTAEMDHVYALPYMRTYHPSYEALGGVPAIQEVQFSIIHNRGCFGACNFCALAFHQGRYICLLYTSQFIQCFRFNTETEVSSIIHCAALQKIASFTVSLLQTDLFARFALRMH